MSSLFLTEDLDPATAVGARVVLTGPEAKHAVSVSRVRAGERVSIGDGAGLVVTGPVVGVQQQRLELEVAEVRREEEPAVRMWLVQALAKGDRDELAVQAATELGVHGVVPWAAERSVSRWEGPKRAKGEERWRSIVREASKQSLRARVPQVAAHAATRDIAALCSTAAVLVLDPTAAERLTAQDPDALGADVYLVVGPEGGVSPAELEALTAAGARRVRLGREVLRTSTAGPAALAVLNANSGRW